MAAQPKSKPKAAKGGKRGSAGGKAAAAKAAAAKAAAKAAKAVSARDGEDDDGDDDGEGKEVRAVLDAFRLHILTLRGPLLCRSLLKLALQHSRRLLPTFLQSQRSVSLCIHARACLPKFNDFRMPAGPAAAEPAGPAGAPAADANADAAAAGGRRGARGPDASQRRGGAAIRQLLRRAHAELQRGSHQSFA